MLSYVYNGNKAILIYFEEGDDLGEHYYSQKPESKSNKKLITDQVGSKSYKFYVDQGVFSKSGIDFGSKLLIEFFQAPNVQGPIADIGCGWGPIGISIASDLSDREVVMVDINERAVELANMNASLNGVTNVKIFQNDLLDGFKEDSFASMVTNPPIRAGKQLIFQLYEQSVKALKAGGELWVVIQKKQGAPSTEKKLMELGLEVSMVKKAKGYFLFRGKKLDSDL